MYYVRVYHQFSEEEVEFEDLDKARTYANVINEEGGYADLYDEDGNLVDLTDENWGDEYDDWDDDMDWLDPYPVRRTRGISSTDGDYGPSNPWDAPGMSVSDFISGVSCL